MSTTFTATPPNVASAIHNGSALKYQLPFRVASASPIGDSFVQLSVSVHDKSTSDIIFSKLYLRQDIEQLVLDAQNGDNTVSLSKLVLPLPTGDASSVIIYAKENGKAGDDLSLNDVEVSISKPPSAPAVSLANVAFTKNQAGTGVAISGSFKITPNLNENVSHVQMIVTGLNSSNTSFRHAPLKVAFAPTELSPSYEFSIANSALASLKPDSSVKFYAICEANDYESALSAPVVANASIRLAAPILTSAKSLQDQKITVSGTIKQQAASGTNDKYSILVQKVQEGASLNAATWSVSDKIDIDVPKQTGASAQVVSFSQDVTKIGGVNIELGQVYAFVAVRHSGAFVQGKSIDVATKNSAIAPPLDQSVASDARTAVAVKQFDKTLAFAATQSFDVDKNALTFTPGFKDANGNVVTLPSYDGILYDWYFSSAIKGQIAKGFNASGVSSIPNIFIDKVPAINDEYTLTCSVSYFISSFAISKIEGVPDLTYTLHPQNGQNVVSLASFTAKSKKAKSSLDVPLLKDLDLQLTRVASVRKLAASYRSEFDRNVLTLDSVDLQLMKGLAGTGDLAFNPLVISNGSTTLSAGKNSSDVKDVVVFSDLSGDLAGVYTVRARCNYTDKDTNAPVTSAWAYDSYEAAPSIMNAPTSVAIAGVPSTKGKSFSVAFTVDKKANITGMPASWGAAEPALGSARVNLFDRDGKLITYYVYNFSDSEKLAFLTADVTVDKLSPKEFNELDLPAGEYVYAEVAITYLKKDTTLTSVGAKSDRNTAFTVVAPNIKVTEVTLTQNPELKVAGSRQVNSNGMDSLIISAKVDFGGLERGNGEIVKAIMPADGNVYEHALSYDSTKDGIALYKSGAITPNAKLNYKDALVLVYARHPASSNIATYTVLQ